MVTQPQKITTVECEGRKRRHEERGQNSSPDHITTLSSVTFGFLIFVCASCVRSSPYVGF